MEALICIHEIEDPGTTRDEDPCYKIHLPSIDYFPPPFPLPPNIHPLSPYHPTMTNQAWQISAPGHLSLVDLPEAPPRPGPGEVLVRMKAVSLNFRDLLILHHNPKYPAATTPDLIPCCDGAGIVEAVGEARDAAAAEAREWQPGDRILLHPNSWRRGGDVRAFDPTQTLGSGAIPGTLRRWAVWRADQLIRVPAGLSLAEAATLFTSGVTAWNALMHGAVVRLGGGEQQQQSPAPTVVTQGTGGVSCWAIMVSESKET